MSNNDTRNGRRKSMSLKTLGAVAVVAAVVLIVFWLKVVRGGEDPTSHLATFVVKRGPLTISVLESGTILPRDQITLRNEVEGRTSIVSLVPDGSLVKAGDMLVELDASTLKDQIIDQDIMVQKAEAAHISAIENLAVIENQAKSDTDKAELTLKFALQDLQQYEDGIYPKDVNDLQAEIRLAEEQVKRAEDVNDWSKKLYEEKYLSETEYTADRLSLQGTILKRDVALSELVLLKDFTHQRQIDQLTSDVKQAEMALERTQRKASADVVQAKAELKARELEYTRQQEKMKKAQDQLSKTTIKAPMDGMVVYATSSSGRGPFDRREPMDIGVEVTERQELINLPTTQSMKARVDIHETSLQKVGIGLPAVITVDALGGKKFLGRVGLIAPLPDARMMYMNPDLKVYSTDILLEDADAALRTGMSCKTEIIVAQYEDALYVPVQAVLRVAGKPTVFIVKDGSVEERQVEVGLDDNNVIRIISGLDEGEIVLMTPPLKSAAIEPGSRTAGLGSPDDFNAPDAMKDRINQKLEEANGAGQGMPMMQGPAGSEDRQGPPSDQMDQRRQRLENMSPEERQKEIENMKRQFENLTPEEQAQRRQQFQGQGGGSRQSREQRPADGQRQGGGQRPPGSERN
ncbi:MAG TPA: efflux RND transporter periplasmic adaptor subunit [Sedimentisphaerales bacterium]|nr:efflux RND transporter periplasmic adaptor subunit [Sedimentisphaerales bacterium]